MKIAGFTIIRNAIKYDYPVVESINSVLELVDIFYIGVGNSDDKTREMIVGINSPKIVIIDTVWDEKMREGGKVLSNETNKIFDLIPLEYDWCFYIQADEVLSEKNKNELRLFAQRYLKNHNVDGLLFDYIHFYGSYDFIGTTRKWYRKEIRMIKNNKSIRSYKDAQGFRKKNNEKLNAKVSGCTIHHYGWVKHPTYQKEKEKNFHKMWHNDEWVKTNVKNEIEFDYSNSGILEKFMGKHPAVMNERIKEKNWEFNYDRKKIKQSLKEKILMWIEKKTGKRLFEYQNYIEI